MEICNLVRVHENESTSTLDMARDQAILLKPNEIRIYTTAHQTKGRGTHSRQWLCPPNVNIYPTYSFLVPESSFNQLHFFPLITGYAVSMMLKGYKLDCTIKWPNDVLIHFKKMTGILCESYPLEKNRLINLGIGLNVNMNQALCNTIEQPVTSMSIAAEKEFSVEEVQERLTFHLTEALHLFMSSGFNLFYEKISETIERFEGKDIKFDTQGNGLFKGKILGIDRNGQLSLQGHYCEATNKEKQIKSFLSGKILREI